MTWTRKRPKGRLIPVLGLVRETGGAVKPTPQFKQWPLFGVLLMGLKMSDSQQVTITIQPVDKKGNKAPVDGVPTWLTDNSELLALEPAADGMSCTVKAVGPLGSGTVSVSADADLGAGSTPISGLLEFEITGGTAVAVTLTAATPVEQP